MLGGQSLSSIARREISRCEIKERLKFASDSKNVRIRGITSDTYRGWWILSRVWLLAPLPVDFHLGLGNGLHSAANTLLRQGKGRILEERSNSKPNGRMKRLKRSRLLELQGKRVALDRVQQNSKTKQLGEINPRPKLGFPLIQS